MFSDLLGCFEICEDVLISVRMCMQHCDDVLRSVRMF